MRILPAPRKASPPILLAGRSSATHSLARHPVMAGPELVYGVFKPEAVAYFQRVMSRMKDEGCHAVVLGCTEIPLIMDDTNSPLPTLDSTRLLARAALRRAVQGAAMPASAAT